MLDMTGVLNGVKIRCSVGIMGSKLCSSFANEIENLTAKTISTITYSKPKSRFSHVQTTDWLLRFHSNSKFRNSFQLHKQTRRSVALQSCFELIKNLNDLRNNFIRYIPKNKDISDQVWFLKLFSNKFHEFHTRIN